MATVRYEHARDDERIRQQYEVLATLDDTIRGLLEAHRARRAHWYYHEYVPWERGESFKDKPWDPSQCTVSEDARTALVVNLLTEDNLPYYHETLSDAVPEGSALKEWGRLWTAEEGQHAIALRSYLMTSRNCDPKALEDDRMVVMSAGWAPEARDPSELFSYTAVQELATRVSHRNAGRITDDPAAYEIMRHIAADENHHFLFYRDLFGAMLAAAPQLMLEGLYRTLDNFQMPGTVIPGFLRRSIRMAKAGVYNLRIHHDRIVKPLLEHWRIGDLTDLGPAARWQEEIMAIPERLLEKAERFERRVGVVV